MAEKEYVNKENLIRHIDNRFGEISTPFVLREIKNFPNADVVEVVRCKDCKYGRPIDKTKVPEKYFKVDCVVCECEYVVGDEPAIYNPYHFCSCGERKE